MDLSESLALLKSKLWTKKSLIIFSVAGITLLSGLAVFLGGTELDKLTASATGAESQPELSSFPVTIPTLQWGFAIDTLQVQEGEIANGESLSDILSALDITVEQQQLLIANSSEVFDLRKLRAGKPLIRLSADTTQGVDYLVYEPSVYEYIVFELKNDFGVSKTEREVTTEIHTAGGFIESSLWNAMVNNGYSFELAGEMEDALQWSIDFHHLQYGDEFRLVYEQKFVEGEPVGVGEVQAAFYKTGESKEFYSFYFEGSEEETGYYDSEGKPMNKGFLKAPVKYSRISSYYNLNRFHPVLKRRRPHLGTDYAAPYGTPIVAVGNGVVTQASYTKGNGNYVRIRHDATHETQYLHMQRFAEGMRPGAQVSQGQVIGYVGSTGLATGPHVCFRFWKNGRQVNHLKLEFPPPSPLPDSLMPQFTVLRDQYLEVLNGIQPQWKEVESTASADQAELQDPLVPGNP